MTFVVLHPVHATSGEIEWNPKSQRLEIAWRMDAVDEYTLLRSIVDNARDLQRVRQVTDDHRLAYVVEHFQLEPNLDHDGELRRRDASQLAAAKESFHWIGREESGASVWWYFEIDAPGRRRPTTLAVTALWDVDDRYVHRLRCLDADRSVSMAYSSTQAVCALPERTAD